MGLLEVRHPCMPGGPLNGCILAVTWTAFSPLCQGAEGLAKRVQGLSIAPEHVTADGFAHDVDLEGFIAEAICLAPPAIQEIASAPEHPQRLLQGK